MSVRNPAQSPALGTGITLPIFINKQNKFFYGFVMFFSAAVMYMASNRLHIFPPQLLPMTRIDEAVPLVPWTLWIYLSEYFFFAIVYAITRDYTNLNKYWYSFLALQTVSVAIFWIWPTTFPRELYPIPVDIDQITYYAFQSLRATDTAANCCPSLHVSSVFLSCFIFLDEQKRKFPFFIIWGSLIALSTLTTKQHYLVDVVVGTAMAIVFYWVFHRWIQYRPVSSKR
jgi:membrane-associated phospholipid phosphatase